MSLPAFLLLIDTAENRTLCRARALSKREAFVASGRGRRQATEAGADLPSKYADSPRRPPIRNKRDADGVSADHAPHQRRPPHRGESNSVQGAGVKRAPRQRRVGRAFPTVAQAESPSRNLRPEWDSFSGRRLKRKLHPRIDARNGIYFPDEWLAESPSRNLPREWDALSQRQLMLIGEEPGSTTPTSQLQNPCAVHCKTG